MQHMHPVLPGLCQNPGDACFMEEFSTSPQTVYQSWCMALHVRSQWQEYPWPLSAISTPQIQRSHPQLTASSLPYANPMPHVTSHAIGQPLSISMATGVFSQWVESLRGRLGGGSRRHTEAWADHSSMGQTVWRPWKSHTEEEVVGKALPCLSLLLPWTRLSTTTTC